MAALTASPLVDVPPPRRAMTIEEWVALDEDEAGELVNGFLEGEEVPDYVHELTVSFLLVVLGSWLGQRGFVIGSEAKMKLSPKSGRKPDLIVHLPGSKAPPRHGPLKSPPDIAIEVVTPTFRDERRDRVEKRVEYAAFGIRFYWLVDPALQTFEILELGDHGEYRFALTATDGVLENVPGCDGLTIDVTAMWANLARLSDDET